ncbi:MAG: hypothetical protein QM608_06280 [Caulobacter sp.]
MSGDVNRLFSMINQINLPYQIFETAESEFESEFEPGRSSLQAEGEAMVRALEGFFGCPPAAANEDLAPPCDDIGFLQAYAEKPVAVSAGAQSADNRLADIFKRMRERA